MELGWVVGGGGSERVGVGGGDVELRAKSARMGGG